MPAVDVDRLRRALEAILGVPATEGNLIEPLRNGDEIFPAMLAAIRDARRTVDLTTFIYWTGDIAREFAGALADRARNGVRVRVVLDALGARHMDAELLEAMQRAGVQVHRFRPPSKEWKIWKTDHRTHRKILVCDETVGFTGGVGIAAEWEGDARDETEWRDTHFRIRGPAVAGLTSGFLADWVESGRRILDGRDEFPSLEPAGSTTAMVVRGTAEYEWNDMVLLKRALLELARERIWIATAYFSPDDATVELLCAAANRGVEIKVLVPGPHIDKRIAAVAAEEKFAPLLDAGVEVWRYQPSMLHTKVMTVDGLVADIGSANLNSRSLAHDEEIDVVAFDPGLVATLESHFEQDLERSEQVRPDGWNGRGAVQRAAEAVVGAADDLI